MPLSGFPDTTTRRFSAAQIATLVAVFLTSLLHLGATPAAAVSAGDIHTCALTTGGGVKCWGSAVVPPLGADPTLTPVDVTGLVSGVAAVSAGGSHTCAVTTGGGVKCWGAATLLGSGSTDEQLFLFAPVGNVSGLESGVAAVSAGDVHTCAVTTGGGVKCWGRNEDGRLGDGTTTNRSTPVDVSGLASGVAAVSAGGVHTCAVTTGGGVKCWGSNSNGQLGNGTSVLSLTPVDVSGLESGVAAVSAGYLHTCAVMTGGGVKCWGFNSDGQLGNGTKSNLLTPVDVSGLESGVAAVSAGGHHTCAVTTGGGVKCWGDNVPGQLGGSHQGDHLTPMDVSALGSNVAVVSAGQYHTCALATDGVVKCWGENSDGQLGDDSRTNRRTPVYVMGVGCGDGVVAAGEGCDGGLCCASDCTLAASGTECRQPAAACDLAESCDGVASDCPADAVATAGSICSPALGACDLAEICDGASPNCPDDLVAAAGSTCRAVAGACDLAERCDGVAYDCPDDAVAAAGSTCRVAAGICDVAESCDGTRVACPGDELVADGTVCDVAGPCLSAACQAGACGDLTAVPRDDCRVVLAPAGSTLKLKDSFLDSKDQFEWAWKKGESTTLAELGAPNQVDGAAYGLCMYDESGLAPELLLSAEVTPGTGWSALGALGYKFNEPAGTQGGITQILAKQGGDGRASVQVKGRGAGIEMPALPLVLPVRMQLELGGGACVEATFGNAGTRRNDSGQFMGGSD